MYEIFLLKIVAMQQKSRESYTLIANYRLPTKREKVTNVIGQRIKDLIL